MNIDGAALLRSQLESMAIDGWEAEFPFHQTRKWRFDFAWPDEMVAVEVDGAIHTTGRHTRGAGVDADNEKLNAAQLDGWRVFRFSTGKVQSGYAAQTIIKALDRYSQRVQRGVYGVEVVVTSE